MVMSAGRPASTRSSVHRQESRGCWRPDQKDVTGHTRDDIGHHQRLSARGRERDRARKVNTPCCAPPMEVAAGSTAVGSERRHQGPGIRGGDVAERVQGADADGSWLSPIERHRVGCHLQQRRGGGGHLHVCDADDHLMAGVAHLQHGAAGTPQHETCERGATCIGRGELVAGSVANGLSLLKCTVPREPVTASPAVSTAVRVIVLTCPAAMASGNPDTCKLAGVLGLKNVTLPVALSFVENSRLLMLTDTTRAPTLVHATIPMAVLEASVGVSGRVTVHGSAASFTCIPATPRRSGPRRPR